MMNYKRLNFTKLAASIALTILLVGVGFCFIKSANAQEEIEQPTNLRIFYQGQLSGSEGNPVTDGEYNMRFRIYDAQEEWGNILWQEEYTFYNGISVGEGQFKVILGRENPIELDLSQSPFWLGIAIGILTEENEIEWAEESQPRKKITTLSELLGIEELTPEQWENLSQLLREKLGDETDIVLLFDIAQLESLETEEGIDFSSNIIGFFQNFINFIDEKISQIGEKINQILTKLENIISTLAEMKHKIDVLYEVLVVQQGLEPSSPECQTQNFYYDGDNDGFGNYGNFVLACEPPAGYVSDNTDCNDGDPSINPMATEICDDGIDNNCDSKTDTGDEDCQVAPPAPVCDAEHLSLCTTPELCEGASLYWYNETCNAELETYICTPDWSCTEWEPVPSSIPCGETFTQTRTCTDSNSCGIEEGKPAEEKEAIGTNDEACGTTSCDTTLNLVGECQNPCVEGSCQTCTPECVCTEGFSDCDSDKTNGCEVQGECSPGEEPEE